MLLAAAVAVTAVALANAGSTSSAKGKPTARPATPVPSPTAVPAVFPGPLNGEATARGNALRRPIAAVIDNFAPDARPQSGLSAASVVYETATEGGTTRLMAIFLETGAGSLGPIRSARPYFVDWAAGYHALFVHAGGSPSAQSLLARTPQLSDVDAQLPAAEFSRSLDRSAPHNLYTSTIGVRAIALRAGFNRRPSFPWVLHKKAAPPAARGTAGTIHVDFSIPAVASPEAYAVDYKYDAVHNVYLRSNGGVISVDQATNRQIHAANVVVLYTDISLIPNDPQQRLRIRTTGTGDALVFRDGHVVKGRWSKPARAAGLRLVDGRGRVIPMNPGPTWIEVTAPGGAQYGP